MEEAVGYGLDVFFVPVGKANVEFLEILRSICNGHMLSFTDGEQLSRRTYLAMHVSLFGEESPFRSQHDLSERDKRDMEEIKERGMTLMLGSTQDNYRERQDSNLPAPGSRVRRGPDWRYDDKQDQFMAGTIIGHAKNHDAVWVDWDTDQDTRYRYRYGEDGCFDVLLVEEPRLPDLGNDIAVGCEVEPSIGWTGKNTTVSQDAKGKVVRIYLNEINQPKALVRWSTGERGEYNYMLDDNSLPEIQLTSSSAAQLPVFKESTNLPNIYRPVRKTVNKNKNKNL